MFSGKKSSRAGYTLIETMIVGSIFTLAVGGSLILLIQLGVESRNGFSRVDFQSRTVMVKQEMRRVVRGTDSDVWRRLNGGIDLGAGRAITFEKPALVFSVGESSKAIDLRYVADVEFALEEGGLCVVNLIPDGTNTLKNIRMVVGR